MNELNKFTTTDKIELLKLDKWYCVEGFMMEYEKPDEVENVVLSFEEVCKKLKEGVEWFCLDEYGDWFQDLDSAWDEYLDRVYDKIAEENDIGTDIDEPSEIYVYNWIQKLKQSSTNNKTKELEKE